MANTLEINSLEDLRYRRMVARHAGNKKLVASLDDKIEAAISAVMKGKRGIDIEASAGPEEDAE